MSRYFFSLKKSGLVKKPPNRRIDPKVPHYRGGGGVYYGLLIRGGHYLLLSFSQAGIHPVTCGHALPFIRKNRTDAKRLTYIVDTNERTRTNDCAATLYLVDLQHLLR